MVKQELRKLYLQKRSALTLAEYADLNKRLFDNFFRHIGLSSVKYLHVFLPIVKNNEPDTWILINHIRKEFPLMKLVVPRIKSPEGEMENFLFEPNSQLEENSWGIAEPKRGTLIKAEEIDMVVTPLLVFDQHGQRVGYGKGFYDRLLSSCKQDCIKVGLSLFDAIDKVDDSGAHDELLTMAVTPSKVYQFK